jgi:hypothetical protein
MHNILFAGLATAWALTAGLALLGALLGLLSVPFATLTVILSLSGVWWSSGKVSDS